MVEEETLEGGPKGGGKEELGEEEWVSLNTLSLKNTKKMTRLLNFLELERGKERGVLYALEWRKGWVYIVVMEKIWIENFILAFGGSRVY